MECEIKASSAEGAAESILIQRVLLGYFQPVPAEQTSKSVALR
jgi:hypothetical protein